MLMQQEQQEAVPQVQPNVLLQLSCQQSRLHHALSLVSRAVTRSAGHIEGMPILGYLRLEVKDGLLSIAATNLYISMSARVELLTQVGEGILAAPARLLADLISNLPAGPITVTVTNELMLLIAHAHGTATLKGISADEYPPIPDASDGELPVLLPVARLKEVIREVSVAVARDDPRPALTCLYVHIEQQKMTVAATDSFRTASTIIALPPESEASYDLLIPQRMLAELPAVLPADGMVMMSVTPNRSEVIFHTASMTFASRLIEGKFPNYNAVIPKKEDRQTRVVVQTAALRDMVQLAAIYANHAQHGALCLRITGNLGMEPGSLSIASEPTELGEVETTMTVAVEGEDQDIKLDYRLLLDALTVITTAEVALEIGLTTKAKSKGETVSAPVGVLKPVGANTCLHTFMPMRPS